MRGRPIVIGVGVLALAVLPGCYASTEPATDIGPESATLNARGTANNGPASSWFEYEVNGRVGAPQETGDTDWPANASGPFSQKVTGLSADTEYSFRVCGQDSDGGGLACANTRTFTTKPAIEDAAHGGWWGGCCVSFTVNARSGPAGENPRGTMSYRFGNSTVEESWSFQGTVTCLEADGRRAIVGAVGERTNRPSGETFPYSMSVLVIDGVTAGDRVTMPTPGSDCATAEFGEPLLLFEHFEFVVNDAQAAAPTAR